jgi:hypothetical protein
MLFSLFYMVLRGVKGTQTMVATQAASSYS